MKDFAGKGLGAAAGVAGGLCLAGMISGQKETVELVKELGLPTAFLLLLLCMAVVAGRWLMEHAVLPFLRGHLDLMGAIKDKDDKQSKSMERMACAHEETTSCMKSMQRESKKQTRILRKLVGEKPEEADTDDGEG